MQILWISIFGAAGVLLRFTLGGTPEKTFLINVFGSFLIGVLYVMDAFLGVELRVAIMVGLLGGFTTFSSFSLDVFRYWEEGRLNAASILAVLSPLSGVLAAFMGAWSGRILKGIL